MPTGTSTANLTLAAMLDDVLGNREGSTVRIPVNLLAAQMRAEIGGPSYETLSELAADLAWPAGAQGVVWGDPTEGLRGLYVKSGASDAGSWTRYADLPLTTLTAELLDAKAPLASPTFTGTVGGISKAMVGLGAVDNTADTAKPVSTAQQAALDAKAPLASPTFTGTVGGISKAMVGLGAVDNTADTAKPVSTAQAASDAAGRELAAGLGGAAVVVEDGRAVFLFDRLGPLDSLDMLHGRRRIENLEIPGGEAVVEDGRMPVARDARGLPVIEANLHRQQLEAVWPLVSPMPPVEDGIMGTMMDGEGQTIAGYSPGAYYRLWPARHAGLIIRGDHNRLPQLWWSEDGGHGVRQVLRQITFSQHGISGFRWVRFPSPTDEGEVIVDHNDSDIIRDRRFTTRRAKIPLKARATVKTKMVFNVVCGQSNGGGAGTTESPNGVVGPQTIRTHLPVDGGVGVAPVWPFELLTFNGGTLPHQVGVDAAANTIPIDPAQIASLVPMMEGLGGQASNQGGSRESLSAALALHMAGANGYDGGAFILSSGFGFGGTSWQALFHDGTTRQQAYLNALDAITAAKAFALAKGVPLEVHWTIDQGENNANDDRAVFAARVTDWTAIMQADVMAITGQSVAPQVFLAQTGWTKGSAQAPCGSALGQLDAAVASPDIHILPPGYWADHDGDNVHFKAPENQLRAALYGECVADWLIRGQDAALYIVSASWSGATITLQMTHPVERDTDTIVGLTAALGVSCVDGSGAEIAVSRTEIDGADPTIVRVVCSAAITPGTAVTVRVAHDNAVTPLPKMGFDGGLRSGLRRADWVRYSLIDGRPLPVFANIQSIQASEDI